MKKIIIIAKVKCTCQIFQSHEKYSFSVMNFQFIEITSIKKIIFSMEKIVKCVFMMICFNLTLKNSKIEHVKLKVGVSLC